VGRAFSRMLRRGCFCGLLGLSGLVVAPSGFLAASDAAGVKSIAVSGSIARLSGGQVFVLSKHGTGWTGVVHGSSFRVRIPLQDRVKLHDATVQVISASGSYVGPVVLAKITEKSGKGKSACGKARQPACVDDVIGLGTPSGNISLGRLVGKNLRRSTPTWYLASKASRTDSRDTIRAAARDGRPYGAGNLGLVPGGIPTKAVSKAAAKAISFRMLPRGPSSTTDTASDSCPTTSGGATGTAPGQELDCSGVPNVLNVDVNGNGVLNNVDPSAASIAASTITIGATIGDSQSQAVSYYAPAGLTPASLATFLDPQPVGPGNFHTNPADFSVGVQPDQLFPGDSTGSDVTMSVDCGTLAWCTNATAFNNTVADPQPWAQTSPPYALAADFFGGAFGAILTPPVGTNVPDEIVPGQLIALNGTQTGSGATAQTMMEVGPYFASTPYIEGSTLGGPDSGGPGFMTADSTGNLVSASSTGTLTLKVERPERLPLPGETSSSGLMDTSGLNYWVSINKPGAISGLSANCPPAAYSNISGATIASQPDNFGTHPLVDNTTQDFDPAEANNPGPIEFTVNLSDCETNGTQQGGGSGYAWTPGQSYAVAVSAEGEDGSAGRTSDGFSIVAP
jgi:hypothetical protein